MGNMTSHFYTDLSSLNDFIGADQKSSEEGGVGGYLRSITWSGREREGSPKYHVRLKGLGKEVRRVITWSTLLYNYYEKIIISWENKLCLSARWTWISLQYTSFLGRHEWHNLVDSDKDSIKFTASVSF
jgi:hypothetical protein